LRWQQSGLAAVELRQIGSGRGAAADHRIDCSGLKRNVVRLECEPQLERGSEIARIAAPGDRLSRTQRTARRRVVLRFDRRAESEKRGALLLAELRHRRLLPLRCGRRERNRGGGERQRYAKRGFGNELIEKLPPVARRHCGEACLELGRNALLSPIARPC
jgi:hypothetical protein